MERFETETPEAFQGNALALLQMVYRTQTLPLEVRLTPRQAIRFWDARTRCHARARCHATCDSSGTRSPHN